MSYLGQDPSLYRRTPPPPAGPPPQAVLAPASPLDPTTPAPLPVPYTPPPPAQDWAGVAHRAMDGVASVWHGFWKCCKLGICILLDMADFFIGRLLGFGIVFDIGCALIATALWGRKGLWAFWEVFDITEQIDAFIPTCTLIALAAWNDQ